MRTCLGETVKANLLMRAPNSDNAFCRSYLSQLAFPEKVLEPKNDDHRSSSLTIVPKNPESRYSLQQPEHSLGTTDVDR